MNISNKLIEDLKQILDGADMHVSTDDLPSAGLAIARFVLLKELRRKDKGNNND